MKFLYLIFLLSILSTPTFSQLQNLDFEHWELEVDTTTPYHNKPIGWDCYHAGLGTEFATSSHYFLYQASLHAQSNKYAIRLSNWYQLTKDVAVQQAAIDYRPTTLTGYFTYEDIDLDEAGLLKDTAQFAVYLLKKNLITSRNDTIGRGIINISEETNQYKQFIVNIEYFTEEQPDSIVVVLDPSLVVRYQTTPPVFSHFPHGSYLTVDNLSLDSPLSIERHSTPIAYPIFPNPATDQIHISNFAGEVTICDLSGRKILTDNLEIHQPLSLITIPGGIYILSLKNGTSTQQTKIIKH